MAPAIGIVSRAGRTPLGATTPFAHARTTRAITGVIVPGSSNVYRPSLGEHTTRPFNSSRRTRRAAGGSCRSMPCQCARDVVAVAPNPRLTLEAGQLSAERRAAPLTLLHGRHECGKVAAGSDRGRKARNSFSRRELGTYVVKARSRRSPVNSAQRHRQPKASGTRRGCEPAT
jgi:hypothetical protein